MGENTDVPIHRYRDGRAYGKAFGRCRPESQVERVADSRNWLSAMAMVDLRSEQIECAEFLRRSVRELRIRFYSMNSIRSYSSALRSFFRFTGLKPHEVTRESVREYLEYLVDSEDGFSCVTLHLAAIRTVFDKMCCLDITLGLMTPRKAKRQPVVLSKSEVSRLLQAAVSLRDALLIGLMYATGMRVSEVCRIRFEDIDFDRNQIRIVRGKGQADRQVMLPESFRDLLSELVRHFGGRGYLFPSDVAEQKARSDERYISARTVQRVVSRTSRLAKITKRVTPHSLRHTFATHSFEDGCDIRRIQKVLGHVHLETTTIYVRVASPSAANRMPSPMDRLVQSVGYSSPGGRSSTLAKVPSGQQIADSASCGASKASGLGSMAAKGLAQVASATESPSREVPTSSAGTAVKRPVGTMRVQVLQRQVDQAGSVVKATAQVSVVVEGVESILPAVCVERQGVGDWLSIQVPALEKWGPALSRLPLAARRRVESESFFRAMQEAVLSRVLSGSVASAYGNRQDGAGDAHGLGRTVAAMHGRPARSA